MMIMMSETLQMTTERVEQLEASRRQQLVNYSADGIKCLMNFWKSPYPEEGLHCNATWDSFICWPTTPANTVVERNCIEIIGKVPGVENAQAFRICDETGNWLFDKTNYSECLAFMQPGEDKSQHEEADTIGYLMFFGSMMSFIALTLTLFIFSYFKALRCDRISVHKNLSFALLIRVLLNIVLTEPIVAGRNGSYTNEAWICRLILILKMYTTVASINWMFIEGLYLHGRVTTSVFSTKSPFRLYYVLGWVFPMTIVTVWAVMMAHDPQKCWFGYTRLKHIYIIIVPITVALTHIFFCESAFRPMKISLTIHFLVLTPQMNLLFLINIIRILVTKLQASVAIETTQVRKAIKATAVLFPLLGLPTLFACINPQDKGDFEDVYLYTNAVLESSQGVFVAILYCFTNSEVIEAIKKQYSRLSWRFQPTCNNNRRKSSRTVSFYDNGLAQCKTQTKPTPFEKRKRTLWVRLSRSGSAQKYESTSSAEGAVVVSLTPQKNGQGPMNAV